MIKITAEIPTITLDLVPPNFQAILEEEMLNTRARIIADTQRGVTADGGGLKPYSASYKKAIDSGRIQGKAPGSHTPNLTATGELMRSIVIEPLPNGSQMRFQGQHAARRSVSHAGAAKKRKAAGIASTRARSASRPSKPRKASGGGSSAPNASIAGFQYGMGRTGWFSFSQKDILRIKDRIKTEMAALSKSLFNRNAK